MTETPIAYLKKGNEIVAIFSRDHLDSLLTRRGWEVSSLEAYQEQRERRVSVLQRLTQRDAARKRISPVRPPREVK